MRRRVQRLQVTTFPFLAVLLCAMGSLILLLLVIDRRAKIVARHKAVETAQAAASQRSHHAGERKEEWERQRLALHALLARRHEDLQDQVRNLSEQMGAAQRNLHDEQTALRLCEENLSRAKEQLAAEHALLNARQAAAVRAPAEDNAPRAELERLAKELAQLEQTLAGLKALRQREQQTYSLVPYKGRRGGNRKPLYIECTADGIILHPDRLALTGPRFNGMEVRREVESRLGRLRPVKADATDDRPYLLMLVRPAGITPYYEAQAALQGLKVDFGYELIDADWVLDFSEAVADQPWRAAGVMMPPDSERAGPRGVLVAPRLPRGLPPPSRTGASGSAQPGGPVGPPFAGGGPVGLPLAEGNEPKAPGIAQGGQTAPRGSEQAVTEQAESQGPPQPPLRHLTPAVDDMSAPRTPPSPLSRLLGSRDLIILIDCRADSVVLHPGGRVFDIDALPTRAGGEPTLVQGVNDIIARRQATVRPGEPPYRPLLRFQIRPDGLRSYYRAFPLLEGLRLPMSRENVD